MRRSQKTPKVTRIALSCGLTRRKHDELAQIARYCGIVRGEAWRRYGSIGALPRTPNAIRDQDWLAGQELRRLTPLSARVWKATLEDALGAIAASRESAVQAVIHELFARDMPKGERTARIGKLRDGQWIGDPLLHRLMRTSWRHGVSRISNQIVLDCQCYSTFLHGGRQWLAVTSLTPGERIAVPLHYERPITGTIRVILREDGEVAVHHAVDEATVFAARPCGDTELGLDKGYTETFTDSDGARHGAGLGDMLSRESDRRKDRWARKQRLHVIAQKAQGRGDGAKAERIERNNLGVLKHGRQRRAHRAAVTTLVHMAVHAVFDKANAVSVEDLSRPIVRYDRGRNTNRRLSGWVKGAIQRAVMNVSRRRGASVHIVNAAYTSQVVRCCPSFGRRSNGRLYCTQCGAVYDVDVVAAQNVLDRKSDPEIGRYTPHRQVRDILQARFRQASVALATGVTPETAQARLQLSCGFNEERNVRDVA